MDTESSPELDRTAFHIHAVYVQANTIKGNRYLDDAGKLMNQYGENYDAMNVSTNGLVFTGNKLESMPYQLRIDNSRIWMSYAQPEVITAGFRQTSILLRDISKAIAVASYSRLGMRVQYLWPIDLKPELVKDFAGRAVGSAFASHLGIVSEDVGFNVTLTGLTPAINLSASVTAHTVRNAKNDTRLRTNFEGDGLVFDVDVSRSGTFAQEEIVPFLRAAANSVEQKFSLVAQPLVDLRK